MPALSSWLVRLPSAVVDGVVMVVMPHSSVTDAGCVLSGGSRDWLAESDRLLGVVRSEGGAVTGGPGVAPRPATRPPGSGSRRTGAQRTSQVSPPLIIACKSSSASP